MRRQALRPKTHTLVATVVTTAYEIGCNAAADAETAGTGALVCAGTGGAIYGWFDNQLNPNADHSLGGVVKSMAINATFSLATAGAFEFAGALAAPVGGAVARAAAKPIARAVARAAEDAAPSGVRRAVSQDGRALAKGCNSFAAATLVLMADGTSKPIAQIKAGDKIADAVPDTDPGTHDQAHTVTDVHVTYDDHDYTDVTVATGKGRQTITGTSHHLYWDVTTRAWTPADHLHSGDHLQTADGRHALITAVRSYTATMVTYNLTVDHLHTYYVEAGTTPVLVHNCPVDLPNPGYLKVTAANPSASEVKAAEFMAGQGHGVELRDPVGTRAGGLTSDLVVNGENWDVYTPTTGNVSRIVSAVASKGSQVQGGGVIIDLAQTRVTADQLANIHARIAGTGARVGQIVVMP